MNREQLSALMDGELEEAKEPPLLARWSTDGDTARIWNEYHLIGDVLREHHIRHTCIGTRVSRALADEPTVLAPARRPPRPALPRWLAVAATVSAVAVTTWTFQNNSPLPGTAPAFTATAPAPVAAPTQVAATTEAGPYVQMHRQWSPLSGFQTVDYTTEGPSPR